MIGEDTQFPHSLVPLALAVLLVRAKLPGAAGADPNAVATLIASAVPIFEYWNNPLRLPRPLASALRDGVFRDGGQELRFVDGRPTKYRLAVHAEDVHCVVDMLMHPERAACIRNRVLRARARKLVTRSRDLTARSAELRRVAQKALARASLVSQPAYPDAAPSP
jgi:hypothetical protein